MNGLDLLLAASILGWMAWMLACSLRMIYEESEDAKAAAQRGMVLGLVAGIVIIVAPELVKALVDLNEGTVPEGHGYTKEGQKYWYVGSDPGEPDPTTGVPRNALPPTVGKMAWTLIDWSKIFGAFVIIGMIIWNAIKLNPKSLPLAKTR